MPCNIKRDEVTTQACVNKGLKNWVGKAKEPRSFNHSPWRLPLVTPGPLPYVVLKIEPAEDLCIVQ